MLLTVETPEVNKYHVYDCIGTLIPYVTSFDTETEEIELMIQVPKKERTLKIQEAMELPVLMQSFIKEDGTKDFAPILVKFKLSGAYATKDDEPI